jgi:hypothetical protein
MTQRRDRVPEQRPGAVTEVELDGSVTLYGIEDWTQVRDDPVLLTSEAERERRDARRPDLTVPGSVLQAVGSIGVATTASFLHSSWQAAIMAVLVIVGLVGLALTWSGRPRRRPRR